MTAPGRSKLTFFFFLALLGTMLVIDIRMIGPYLMTLLMGGILALLTFPVHRRLRAAGRGPKLSALAVTFGLVFLVIGPLGAFSTVAVKQGIAFGQKLARSPELRVDRLTSRVSEWKPVRRLIGDPRQIEAQATRQLRALGAKASGVLLGILGGIPDLLLHLVLAMLTCFFFLTDGAGFMRWLDDKLPLDPDVRNHLYRSFSDTAVSTIWATLAAAATQATLMFVGYLALGVPGTFLAAGATFIFAWIPILGSTPVWLFGAGYLYFDGSIVKAVLMIALGMLTGVADNAVRPLVLRGRSDLHPLISLVAIFGGIETFGLFGVFYGPILAAVLLALLDVWPVLLRRAGLTREGEALLPRGMATVPLNRDLRKKEDLG